MTWVAPPGRLMMSCLGTPPDPVSTCRMAVAGRPAGITSRLAGAKVGAEGGAAGVVAALAAGGVTRICCGCCGLMVMVGRGGVAGLDRVGAVVVTLAGADVDCCWDVLMEIIWSLPSGIRWIT